MEAGLLESRKGAISEAYSQGRALFFQLALSFLALFFAHNIFAATLSYIPATQINVTEVTGYKCNGITCSSTPDYICRSNDPCWAAAGSLLFGFCSAIDPRTDYTMWSNNGGAFCSAGFSWVATWHATSISTFSCLSGTPVGDGSRCATCSDGSTPSGTYPNLTCDVCPVTHLTQPPFSDACSTSLEAGKGTDVNNKCGTLRKPDMVNAEACIAKKIKALSSPPVNYAGPSATIRTTEYQNHLLEIWTKSERLNVIMKSVVYTTETKQACAPVNVAVNKEKAAHGVTHQPSSSGDAAPHVEHRAIDVPEAVSDALMDQVTLYATTVTIVNGRNRPTSTITSDVEDYIHSATVNPPACDSNISWGGRFDSQDWVHFQLP